MKSFKKRTVAIIATVLCFTGIGILSYFGYNWYIDHTLKVISIKYLNCLDTSKTVDDLDATIKEIGTDDFIKRNLSDLNKSYETHKALNPSVDKILFVDRRKNALEVCLFFTGHPTAVNYPTIGQLNLVFFKATNGWKIQDAFFMNRSGKPIPATAEIERQNQIQRYSAYLNQINTLMQARMDNNIENYNSVFSKETDLTKVDKLFTDEQQYLAKNKTSLTMGNAGLLVDSSTDLEALTTQFVTQTVGNDTKSLILKYNFVYENGQWLISDIYR